MHQQLVQPLFAAVDFVHVAIMLVVLLFGVMKQLFDASNKSAKKNAKSMAPALPTQKTQPLAPKPPVIAGGQADGLRSQVEEFLRRANQPPGSPQPQIPPQRPTSEIEILVPQLTRTLVEQRSTTSSQPAPPNRQRSIRRLKRQSVAEHVAKTVTASTQTLAEKADQLGQRIANEDQQFDRELKAKFDHTLGTLTESGTTQTSAGPPATDTPAAQIAALLANPSGVRQAVVINEILHRPSFRW
jgi:hypothetical protein